MDPIVLFSLIQFLSYVYFFFCQEEYLEYPLPLAVCIVMSGQYEDDVDDSHDVVYTGQGGNDGLGNKRQNGDQQMLRGNLALKVSYLQIDSIVRTNN